MTGRPTTWLLTLLRRFFRRRPPEHVGATETWSPLRAVGNVEVSPELVSDVERELEWAVRWHEFEQSMQQHINEVFVPVLAELQRPRSFPELYELVFPEQLNEKTGEWKLVSV